MQPNERAVEKGLPVNLEAERFILGAILLDSSFFVQVSGAIEPEDFSVEKHRRMFSRMVDLYTRGEKIDRVTLANELLRHNELEISDGLAYLFSLDYGLPHLRNLNPFL